MAKQEKQNIETLTGRYQKLHTQKIEAETNLRNATQQLEDLKQQALEEFGTDDIDQLRKKLNEMEQENERQRSQYQASLDKIEADLTDVQEKYNAAQVEAEA